MIVITRGGEFNANKLSEDIVSAFPEFVASVGDIPTAQFFTKYDGETLVVLVPDTADSRSVEILIDQHNPSKLSRNQRRVQEATVRKTSLDTKLKNLGLTAEELRFLLEYAQDEGRKV